MVHLLYGHLFAVALHLSKLPRHAVIGFLIKFRCGCRNHYSRLFSDCLCAHYVWLGKPVQINLDGGKALIPDLSTARQWMLLAGMMVSLAGMEMSSVHVTSMKNPRSSFPKSIYLATAIILILSVLGALSISLVVRSAICLSPQVSAKF